MRTDWSMLEKAFGKVERADSGNDKYPSAVIR